MAYKINFQHNFQNPILAFLTPIKNLQKLKPVVLVKHQWYPHPHPPKKKKSV